MPGVVHKGSVSLQFGFYTPNFDYCGDARVLGDLAAEAEAAGWDGFFIWDHLQVVEPTADPWVALAAMALRTQTIRLGTLVTPLPRRHIAKLAREVLTLDHLSGGRVVLGAGAGYPYLPDYTAFGDELDQKTRAAKFDEGLDVLAALWSGAPVQHWGEHYQIDCGAFQPAVQQPRVPVWVAASWPAKKPVRRAARWDGMVVAGAFGLEVEPDELQQAVRTDRGFRRHRRREGMRRRRRDVVGRVRHDGRQHVGADAGADSPGAAAAVTTLRKCEPKSTNTVSISRGSPRSTSIPMWRSTVTATRPTTTNWSKP
jgi:alkanesulfonate monooxygenase SsuD/methylene tetrahydromethanopterin reductase-like flavin-dependent oxidoreductase (luciferase family)